MKQINTFEKLKENELNKIQIQKTTWNFLDNYFNKYFELENILKEGEKKCIQPNKH